jgi:hypothetical protein
MARKTKILILIVCIVFLICLLFNLLQKISRKENPVIFTEQDCNILLSKIDPLISDIDLKEQEYDYHIDFSSSQKPVIWRTNNPEKVSQKNIPEKFVFFVSSDFFEGCGIRLENTTTKISSDFEHFKCGSERDVWLNIRENSKYVFINSITKSTQGEIEAIFYYSNTDNYGQSIVKDNYKKIESECQKIIDTF